MRVDLAPGDNLTAAVRGQKGEAVTLVIAPGRDPLALAMACAAVGPLAVERAPATRVNAVLAGEGADPVDIDAAVAFLDGARSTTGQLLEVGTP